MTELQITPNSMADTIERYQLEAINSFAVFQFNYDHNFIQIAFKDGMADHLQQKFTGLYNQYGSKAAIIIFYMDLDTENRKLLARYVIARNHK